MKHNQLKNCTGPHSKHLERVWQIWYFHSQNHDAHLALKTSTDMTNREANIFSIMDFKLFVKDFLNSKGPRGVYS